MVTHRNAFPADALLPSVAEGRRESRSLAWKSSLVAALVAGDTLMLVAAFAFAHWLRFDLRISISPEVVPSDWYYLWLSAGIIPLWIGLFALLGLYDLEYLLEGPIEFARVFNACGTGAMLVVVVSFFFTSFVVARGWLAGSWIFSIVFVFVHRFVIRRVISAMRRNGRLVTRAIVVGSNGEARSVARQLIDKTSSGYQVVGIVSAGGLEGNATSAPDVEGAPWLGGIDEIDTIVAFHQANEVIVATSSVGRDQLLALFERLQPLPLVTLRLSSGVYEVVTTGVEVKTVASIPLVTLTRFRLSPLEATLKTVLDYTMTVVGLVLLAPLMAVIALLIRIESRGPALYRRRVLGVMRKPYDAFKFRTMVADADDHLRRNLALKRHLAQHGKIKRDPRVTKLGRWLRRYSLDELPQLFNVLRGEMSLVGPRMITAEEAAKYGSHHVNLLTVKPGLTGLWQVSGRSDLSYEDRIRLDLHYIRNYSVWLDLQILLVQTPSTVIRGNGAY
jgi:exopolysaccharide biosynthesis polyprenyl glycosylphosphotransferase